MNEKSKEIIKAKLEELRFFKYLNPNKKDIVHQEMFKDYQGDGVLKFPIDGLNRIFWIDAESIYEGDGIKDQINGMIPMFKGMGFELNIGKYVEEFDGEKYSKRTIEINGREYDASNASDWATAFNTGFRLVDELLNELNLEERVFGLFMDETSTLIILNDVQFNYLTNLIPEGSTYRPVDIKKMMIEHYGE